MVIFVPYGHDGFYFSAITVGCYTMKRHKAQIFHYDSSQPNTLGIAFSAKSHAGIARRAGRSPREARKLPEQEPRSPREMAERGKPFKGHSVRVEIDDKPSGVVRGECRGGLGGAAAPNRPPSAARRAGGPNQIKEKPSCPQAHKPHLKGKAQFFLPEAAAMEH